MAGPVVAFLACQEAPIRPLIQTLSFIRNQSSWGVAVRFGQLKVPQSDFLQVSQAMGVELLVD